MFEAVNNKLKSISVLNDWIWSMLPAGCCSGFIESGKLIVKNYKKLMWPLVEHVTIQYMFLLPQGLKCWMKSVLTCQVYML